jgi:hypothetical protein
MQSKINIIALIAGVSTFLLIAVSLFVPWWQFIVGSPAIAAVNVSPVNLNLDLLGNTLTVPIVYALNIASALTLASGGIIMLIYSVKPDKSYSKKLLGFGYKKPLYAVILFVIGLFSMSFLVDRFSGFTIPVMGSSTMTLPSGMAPDGANISVGVSAGFGWPFYFAIVVAGLCIAARLYHRKAVASADTTLPPPPQPQ